MDISVIILAAGQSTRFHSQTPKVLHPLGERPILAYTLDLATQLSGTPPMLVVSPESEAGIRKWGQTRAHYVVQTEPLGTGHAVRQAQPLLEGTTAPVLILYGDTPLLRESTLRQLVAQHTRSRATVTILTVERDASRGFGRIVRDESGRIQAIVEEVEATQKIAAIRELNTGICVFEAGALWTLLDRVRPSPTNGEYYLTDCIALAVEAGLTVSSLPVTDPTEALGINTRVDLAAADAALRQRINQQWMLAGVTLSDPATTYIGPDVTIGQDTVIQPNTHLRGKTTIGEASDIGPNTLIESCTIGNRCTVLASVLEDAVMEDDSDIGPFSHLRKGARVCRGAHVGNFGEVKNSTLGPDAKMGHFTYLGDAHIGENVNIGAGTITCNYDGQRKHPTVVEKDAFIGSNSLLIAPAHIGTGAKTGAGSVVTHDVPPYTVVYGVPARVHKQLKKPRETGEQN